MMYHFFIPKRNREEIEPPTVGKWIEEIFEGIHLFFSLLIEFPLSILQMLGLDTVPGPFAQNTTACSLCLCGAFLGITSALGIGLGVGLGVGLNCAQTIYINDMNNSYTTPVPLISNFTNPSTS